MHPHTSDRLSNRPSFIIWLATNTSGVPRAQARQRVALGLALGLLLGLLASFLSGAAFWPRALGVMAGVIGGTTVGALGAVLTARLLDRAARWSDPLLGYSGILRMLLHAGELSFLGALGGGIGGGIGGVIGGMLGGALAGSLIGGLTYRLRGLGTALGVTVGLLAGAIGGLIGGTIGLLGR
jgi:hypothetical protein